MLAHETGWCRGAARPASAPPVLFSPREGGEGSEDLARAPSRVRVAGGRCFRRPARRPLLMRLGGWTVKGRAAKRPGPSRVAGECSALRRLRLPEDLRQLVDRVEQLLALRRVLG